MIQRFFVTAFALLTVLGTLPSSAGAQTAPDPQICPMMLRSFYRSGAVYVANFSAEDAAKYNGSVTFFSDKNAYELTFNNIAPGQLTFALPGSDQLTYGSMDTAGKTGEAVSSCPTFVVARTADANDVGARAGLVASLRGPLPDLPCGKVLQEASMISGSAEPMYAPVKSADAVVKLYIDSDGHGFAASILQSAGDPAIDALALKSSRSARYHPRQFLCTPVIGVYTFRLHYQLRP